MTQALPATRGDRYRIQSLLGKGGMGVVYAAHDQSRRHLVALKCLSFERFPSHKQRERAVALFEHEYHALSQLTHPHIIEAFDYGRDEAGPYYSMECVTGETLRARTPLSWHMACTVMRDVVSALALLHSRSLVHRDLTPLNIHCAPGCPTKLLDFGAMMPAGVAKQLVGTPAFTAPEALQQQSLDGQADLYAVGACLYFAISGRHAFPAHSFEALHGAWRTPPLPLSELVPEVPGALEQLVQSLLSPDPAERPRTAAEVYERLTVIANLSRTEAQGTAQAYLTKPKLVGRATQIACLSQAAHTTAAGTGCAVLVQAAGGLGRSRLLDCAVLEARLAGLRVARADATSGQVTSLGAVSQLLAGLSIDDPALRAPLDTEARDRALQELSHELFAACERAPVALIVDDVHLIDEASRALLAILAAQASEHRLLLVCSSADSAQTDPGSAAGRLAEWSQRLPLAPLDESQSRALLVSMLGDVPNSDVLAVISYRSCRGSPQLLMEAMRALIEQQLLRYAGGEWSIAAAPAAIEASIEQVRGLAPRVRRLSPDALELLEIVALDSYQIMDLTSYPQLLSHRQSARMHRALSELLDAGWVELQAEHVRLARETQRRRLTESMSEERRRQLYSLLAERAGGLGLPPVYEAHYRLRANEPAAAVAAIERFSAFVEQHPRADVLRHPITLNVTDALGGWPDFPGSHPALRARFSMLSVLNAITYRGLPEFAAARVQSALQLIAPFSGWSDYQALADLPPAERLTQAITRAAERCAAPGVGGLDLVGALRGQTRLCFAAALTAYFMCDEQLLEVIPDLTPYQQLTPAIGVVVRVVDALAKLTRGQTWAAWDTFEIVHQELAGPVAEQLDPLTRFTLRGLVLGYLSALHADHGAADAGALIDAYERYMPDNAESQRSRLHLMQGDLNAAAAARRRFELLSVRLGSMSDARLFELPAQLNSYSLCDDSAGLRRAQLALQEVALSRKGWRPRATLAQTQLLRCQGLAQEGLRVIEPLMATLPDTCMDFALGAATHVELLHAVQRFEEAAACGNRYLARMDRAQAPAYRLQLALSQTCAALADHAQAELHFEHACSQLERRKLTGVLSGVAYEIGARIAHTRGDLELAEARLARCGEHFRIGKHPALTARYNTLEREIARVARAERSPESTISTGSSELTDIALHTQTEEPAPASE